MSNSPSSLSLFDLTGKRILITGASQGIGFSLAEGLGKAGATLIINGRRQNKLDDAQKALEAQGIHVETAAFDVTKSAEVKQHIETLEQKGPIDVLINNAGIQRRAPLDQFKDEDWDDIIATNLTSVYLVAKYVARGMIERKGGKIINICSVQSELGRQTIAPYAASKGAVKMLTKGMCADWARFNIQINGLAPGYFATEMNQALVEDAAFTEWLCQRTPAQRWGKVEELQGASIFFASDASNFVNGQILLVDGGLTSVV